MTQKWGEDYVTLALRIEKHFEGFVDAYCGPPELKARIDKEEKKSLDELYDDAVHLLEAVPRGDNARRIYLERQVTGIAATIRVLQGEEINYTKQVELFFDIKPEKVPDSRLEKQKDILQDIFGNQDLTKALEEWRKKREVPKDALQDTISIICEECRKRCENLLSLPEGEHVNFVLVQNKPWGGYNWYLGNYKSRIEINTDIPVQATGLLQLVSHESYPGHHTEHSIKENVLYRGQGFLEATVFVYNTPECLISEGIGNCGFHTIFTGREEAYQFMNEKCGSELDVETDAQISEALNKLSACGGNASLMLHQENASPSEVIDYMVDVGLTPRERAEKHMEFITNPLFRAYVFNYYVGEEIVSTALKEVDLKVFYEKQICPSNIRFYRV